MTDRQSNSKSPNRHDSISALDLIDSFDEEHDSQNWNLLQKVHETFSQQKHGKFRHSRRQRKKKKELENCSQIKHRSTLDAVIFNEMCDKADKDCENEVKEETVKEGNRKSKRSFKLLRTNERDSKHDVAGVNYYETNNKHCCLLPKNIKVETRNRFRCLLSKPVDDEKKKNNIPPAQVSVGAACSDDYTYDEPTSPISKSLKERETFHDTFSFLIRLGSTDKDRFCQRQISQEETRWQNELKDLIWLELQAYRADMTPMAMDEYLCKQREAVGALLQEIMAYRFDAATMLTNETSKLNSSGGKIDVQLCGGCLSMYCQDCTCAQSEALKQVENLLTRLEAAEALFPSLQAFSLQYPMYRSSNFTGRIKAMCLWYNMTKNHRLKLIILGRLLTLLHRNKKLDDCSLLDCTFGRALGCESDRDVQVLIIADIALLFLLRVSYTARCIRSSIRSVNNLLSAPLLQQD
ncbi:mitogen-activated protein kinase kinase kinase 4 isoform X2 [Nasonia vitripennis]|uniref:Mitogen-activated protein kinase kinase kinase N-terminal domain-containing protein n=1 Tax=Nasonia vitripennis TaxID=7425 RepID=A0A7M7QE23_NASVI|nr:mitogen-activated protein kinase kinase kinase 4 isoform X2 [Nasonia vitripennis]